MNNHRDRDHNMGIQDFFTWRSQAAANLPAAEDEELAADVDEPPNHRSPREPEFYKAAIRPQSDKNESLLTKALHTPETDVFRPEMHVTTDLSRRRSMISNTSLASTAELTSDGGLTSPARTNTPSPPLPKTTYTSFASYSLATKPPHTPATPAANVKPTKPVSPKTVDVSPTTQPPAEVPKKRCITFACGGRKDPATKPVPAPTPDPVTAPAAVTVVPLKRPCMIKFACPGPKPLEKPKKAETTKIPLSPKPTETQRRIGSRSPSMSRKLPRPTLPSSRSSSSTVIRRLSQNAVAVRAKPNFIVADEKTIQSSEATRFHEFASETLEEDDWIRKESDNPRERLTIDDTLKMENAIRRLGSEAEEEAMEEDDEEEDDEDQDGNDSDDENDLEDDDENDRDSIEGSDEEGSDGNETDNEAGFADSDDESDGDGEFAFWTPGRHFHRRESGEATYRSSVHRTASASSTESLKLGPPKEDIEARRPRRRPIKIRPGTPDLPDSTDFVCGTLDEDRPLEDAYVSCMEQRKHAKHKQTPQDIDPSFPTSDPEDGEDEHDVIEPANDSEEHIWLHGKFEDSDQESHGRRRSTVSRRNKSPAPSPRRLRSPAPLRRLHSPPPPKTRLRSPPPRKLFGHSPKRMRSPPPARTIRSPPASPLNHAAVGAIAFAPLGSRPGLTHTKSLPRTPNVFCRQYMASRLAAANGNNADGGDNGEGHVRGAIDIVKGLESKRQRRKENFYRKGKGQVERKPQPGKGAERMRELGLLMAGKTGAQDPYMLSA